MSLSLPPITLKSFYFLQAAILSPDPKPGSPCAKIKGTVFLYVTLPNQLSSLKWPFLSQPTSQKEIIFHMFIHSIIIYPERKWNCYSLSCVWLFATPWTVACQTPLSMGFSRQEYWSGLSFPSLGDLPDPGIKRRSLALQADSLPSEPSSGKPIVYLSKHHLYHIAQQCLLNFPSILPDYTFHRDMIMCNLLTTYSWQEIKCLLYIFNKCLMNK